MNNRLISAKSDRVHVQVHGWVHGLNPHVHGVHGSLRMRATCDAHTPHTPTRPHFQNTLSHITRMTPVHPCTPCTCGADPCTHPCTPVHVRVHLRARFSFLHTPAKKEKKGGKE